VYQQSHGFGHLHALCFLGWMLSPFLLPGCSKNEEPVTAQTPRPVKTVVVEAPDIGGIRRFPGRIDALNKAELSFRVPGTVQELPVKEGDRVEEGQLLVALDPTDFEIALKDAQAAFDRAKNDFERAQELVEKDFISRSDFDAKEAQFKSAEAALEQAKQDLGYTKLSASFPATVAERYVQRFEEVQAKQPVLAVHDSTQLEVKIDVPENVMLRMRPSETGRPEPGRVPVTASFDKRPGTEFDLTLREVATRADPATQTFQVTFTMPAPADFLVLPGMTATVTADLSTVAMDDSVLFLPAAAVSADASLQPFVWVVDEEEKRVHKNPVEVGRLSGWSIEIKGGLEPGSRVVTAGVGYLAEGMQVRLLPAREEAEPRPAEAPGESPVPAPTPSAS
jgi:RND family efflux transporter MFP subunit